MRDIDLQRIKHLGLKQEDFKPHKSPEVVELTREDFTLLSVEQEVIYHIIEPDGTMTIKKGINK